MKLLLATASIILFLCASSALAHKLNLFVWKELNTITVETSLSGGRTLAKGAVQVVNTTTQETVLAGETGPDGRFSFTLPDTLPSHAALDIIVSSGDGHQATWQLKPDEHTRSEQSGRGTLPAPKTVAGKPHDERVGACLDSAEFERLIDLHLEKKLEPLRSSLFQLTAPSPSLGEIVGGIGYLIGIAGIIGWFKSRKHSTQ